VPGLALALVEDGDVSYARGFGVTTALPNAPVAHDTRFQAASLSKPLFAYAVLNLCAEGVLALDTPLSTYWSDPALHDPRLRGITTRQVLSHTTGLPNWREGDDLALEAAPGERFGYSGEGFEYLQRVVEHVVGQALHTYMGHVVLAPLGMVHSTYAWPVDGQGAFLLDDTGNVGPPGAGVDVQSSAAFSLLTTGVDYGRFLQAMLSPDTAPAVLDCAGVAAMLTPQTPVGRWSALSWALGWGVQQVEGGTAFWHWGGSQNGYTAYVMGLPARRSGLVVLTNGEQGLSVCAEVTRRALQHPARHPAFDWLLPLAEWSPTGR